MFNIICIFLKNGGHFKTTNSSIVFKEYAIAICLNQHKIVEFIWIN